jgi:hypothetical protein
MLTTARSEKKTRKRGAERGAAMVEAIVVISIFILFFLGMVYFRSMYQQKLRVMRLSRTAAVGFALSGCTGSPTQNLTTQDLNGVTSGSSGTINGTAANVGGSPGANPSVGQNSKNPVGGALSDQGMMGDKIAALSLSAAAAGTSKSTFGSTVGFQSNVTSTSYMSCGEPHKAGDFSGAISYAESMFSTSF